MADDRELITAAELDEMTPDERARVFNESIVTDLDQLPAEFRARIEASAARLSEQHPSSEG